MKHFDLRTPFSGSYLDLTDLPPGTLAARKNSTENRANTNVLTNDNDLIMSPAPGLSYAFFGMLMLVGNSSNDAKISFPVINGAELRYSHDLDNSSGQQVLFGVSTGNRQTTLQGALSMGTDPGDFVLQWAQQNAGSEDLTLREGSFLILVPIGPS